MPYIGNPPAERFTSFAYQDLTGGSGTSFTLDNAVGNPQEIEVFVNNVRQEPGVAYTVSGTALTMTGSIASTDDFYVVFQGKAIQTATHPSDRALTATDGTFTGDLTVDTNTLHVDAANNRVGVGTTSPAKSLDVNIASATVRIRDASGGNDFSVKTIAGPVSLAGSTVNTDIGFMTNDTERLRILAGGGLTFNGDTAAANALDDYEEGTWTGTLKGQTSDPSTTVTATGYYTKIGRLVRVSIDFDNVNTTGAAGRVEVHGVPITQGTGAGGAANGNAALYNFNIHSCNGISVQHYNGVLFVYCSRDQNTWVNATHLAGANRYLQITATYHT